MEAMILIGGLGTRIKSIENEKPKCLINVSNKPFIYWIILYLLQNGIEKIIFCFLEIHFFHLDVGGYLKAIMNKCSNHCKL